MKFLNSQKIFCFRHDQLLMREENIWIPFPLMMTVQPSLNFFFQCGRILKTEKCVSFNQHIESTIKSVESEKFVFVDEMQL